MAIEGEVKKSDMKGLIAHLKTFLVDEKLEMFEYPSIDPRYVLPHSIMLKGKLKANEEIYDSWGIAETKELALLKAVVEFIERINIPRSDLKYKKLKFGFKKYSEAQLQNQYPQCSNWNFNNSNGVALHTSLRAAKENALNEVIERHVILKAQIDKIAPFTYNFEPSSINEQYFCNLEIKGHLWKAPLGRYVVALLIESEGKYLYTCACEKTQKEAEKKAFYEMSPNIVYFNSPNKTEIRGFDNPIFLDNSPKTPVVASEVKKSDVFFSELNLIANNNMLKGVKVVCPKMIALPMKNLTDECVNNFAVDTKIISPIKSLYAY